MSGVNPILNAKRIFYCKIVSSLLRSSILVTLTEKHYTYESDDNRAPQLKVPNDKTEDLRLVAIIVRE